MNSSNRLSTLTILSAAILLACAASAWAQAGPAPAADCADWNCLSASLV